MEFPRSKEMAAIAATIALGLGVTACGGNQSSDTGQSLHNANPAGKNAGGLKMMDVGLGYCDGQDLIIEHGAKNPDKIHTEKRPNDPACADGKLSAKELSTLLFQGK